MISPPLDGIRVLELGELLAGPFIGTVLGEFGAEIIKIERPGRGDVLRHFGPMHEGESLYWAVNSRNKKSVVLDFSLEAGREVLWDLLAESDVLINSLRPGTLERWGFDEAQLRDQYPLLVVVYASAYGRTGPNATKGGYDPIAQGFSGLSYVTGDSKGPPMRAGGAIPICDFMTGVAGALGAVLSLYARDNSTSGRGTGQSVDIALYDVAFRMMAPLLGYYDLSGEIWQRTGNHSLGGAPTGHFMTKDEHWVCVSVQNDEQFRKLARLMNQEEWLDTSKYSQTGRTKNRNEICREFAAWVKKHTRADLIRLFDEEGLVIGSINSVADMSMDPHLAVRGCSWVEDPVLGKYRTPDIVPRLSETPGKVHSAAPSLGENTLEVLRNYLNYSTAKCEKLSVTGVLGDRVNQHAIRQERTF